MALNITAAVSVREMSGASAARRVAVAAAERSGLDETACGRAALVATELATNLAKHARDGEILVRRLDHGAAANGIEIVAIDSGPGMSDVGWSRTDGHSTSGTLGHGLGAVERQSDDFHIYSHASGTVIAATVLERTDGAAAPPLDIGGLLTCKPGEDVCGDAWAWHLREDRLALVLIDGLGHGLQAMEAAHQGIQSFERTHGASAADTLVAIHAALKVTRGAAVAVLVIDIPASRAQYAGAGNISGTIVSRTGRRQGMVSMNGTAGLAIGRIQEFTYPLEPGDTLVLHSDGLSNSWDLGAYPGLRRLHPSLIAGVLYRDFSRRRDDAAIAVVQQRNRTLDPQTV